MWGIINLKVSIVIPIYNVEKYLRECINSVTSQTYPNIEIILVDDGSTDNSKAICKEYEQKYSDVKLVIKENGGLSDARNAGILKSTGQYILFLDADDYWDNSNFILDLVEYIKKNSNIDYIFFKYKYFYQHRNQFLQPIYNLDAQKISGKSGIECLDYIFRNMEKFDWFAWAGIVRRDFIIEHNLFFVKDRKYEDMLWTPQVFINAKLVGFYDKYVYIYRLEREGQITSEISAKSLEDNIFVAMTWFNYLSNIPMENNLKKKLFLNLNLRYFYAIKYAGFLGFEEKKLLITMLKKNKYLLQYCKGKNKIIRFLCNMIGFTLAIQLLYLGVNFKRKIF